VGEETFLDLQSWDFAMNGTELDVRQRQRRAARIAITVLAAGCVGVCVGSTKLVRAGAERTGVVQQTSESWPAYGGQAAQDHYSSLSQINRENVKNLRVAWTFDTGEKGSIESTPVIVGRVLYTYTPSLKVVALDAATGKLIWTFDSGNHEPDASRGVSYWSDGKESRLFAGMRNLLYALDPATGKPIESFGEGGFIDLRKGLRGDYKMQSIGLTSPGAIYKDLMIVGGRNPETHPAAPGDIRAFDVRTGALRWRFKTIPEPGEPGYETWPKDAWKTAGAANNWAGMALDEKRGIVYVPTGSAVFDFYGGDRAGDDLFSDCELALDAETGKLLWYFQGVHHDIWDRDFPAPPSLVTVKRDGKRVDAVAQTTKQGWMFLFDRSNGKPLFPIEERKVPQSAVPGEATSPTQPVPLMPEPFTRQGVDETTLTNRTPEAHAEALRKFRTFAGGGQFMPGVLDKPTLEFPGIGGGAEWGGSAVDPNTGVIYINANQVAFTTTLVKNDPSAGVGVRTYRSQCAVCHGAERKGAPPAYPSLVGLFDRMTGPQVIAIVHQGRGRMSSFPNLEDATLHALLEYLRTGADAGTASNVAGDAGPAVPAVGDENSKGPDAIAGSGLYADRCSLCHGEKREGTAPAIPSLLGVGKRMNASQVTDLIHNGKGTMPAFPTIEDHELNTLLRFLGVGTQSAGADSGDAASEMPYSITGYTRFDDAEGYPAVAPPWGTLSAIDLNSGKYLWEIPLGEYPELAAKGMKNTGTENYGGPVVTAGGLVIIAATDFDRKIRAFNSRTGELLWEGSLPFSGVATPATYMVDGKQFIVIATNGSRDQRSAQGAVYVAFSLP
jgi:glucose dehydrogenase